MYNLAQQEAGAAHVAKVGKNGVPNAGLLISVVMLLGGVLLNYLAPEEVFTWLTEFPPVGAIWTWVIILLSQLKFRQTLSSSEVAALACRMPFSRALVYCPAFLVLVVGLMAYFPFPAPPCLVGPGWLLLLIVLYYALGYHRKAGELADGASGIANLKSAPLRKKPQMRAFLSTRIGRRGLPSLHCRSRL